MKELTELEVEFFTKLSLLPEKEKWVCPNNNDSADYDVAESLFYKGYLIRRSDPIIRYGVFFGIRHYFRISEDASLWLNKTK